MRLFAQMRWGWNRCSSITRFRSRARRGRSRRSPGWPTIAIRVNHVFEILHLCDSLFPIGGFSHSDGLEAATATGAVKTAADLHAWMDACLHETLANCDGPAMWRAWHGFTEGRWEDIAALDGEVHALRPSSTGRAASRAMGTRLVRTWHQMRPSPGLAIMLGRDEASFTLPVAFGAVGAAAGIDARAALEGF